MDAAPASRSGRAPDHWPRDRCTHLPLIWAGPSGTIDAVTVAAPRASGMVNAASTVAAIADA
ncbi:hypothetical protein [Burkholderia cenocepacia]|uniref:hypothetical protein n=1 Tax=Burkholderia cenocepacia TaxID=95486 RepID=UPI002AB0E7A0|nr:hypothetical protein [Burkholderia cenocepacia]